MCSLRITSSFLLGSHSLGTWVWDSTIGNTFKRFIEISLKSDPLFNNILFVNCSTKNIWSWPPKIKSISGTSFANEVVLLLILIIIINILNYITLHYIVSYELKQLLTHNFHFETALLILLLSE